MVQRTWRFNVARRIEPGTEADRVAFYAKTVRQPNGCLEWSGADRSAYGSLKRRRLRHGPILAHRYAYFLKHGVFPDDDVLVCHTCDNPPCVESEHLFLGSTTDNMVDAKTKGRLATGVRHGSQTHPESRTRGERNGAAKMTSELVYRMRALYSHGSLTQSELARRFGLGQTQTSRIVRGMTWLAG